MAVLNFPDPAGQSPTNTFGPASTPHATSNGVTYVWTDGSWSIAGVSNGGFLDKDEADSYYVEQSGDNMTGDLTLGTDKITLGVDGSAKFASNAVSIAPNGRTKIDANVGGGNFALSASNANATGLGLFVGTTLSTLTNPVALFQNNGAPVFTIQANGTAGFRNAIFNLEPDNDANYVTTTDAEGNESRVYNGPTLDVKERLQTKTAALEAIKTAAQDASITTLADFKAAIATALANI